MKVVPKQRLLLTVALLGLSLPRGILLVPAFPAAASRVGLSFGSFPVSQEATAARDARKGRLLRSKHLVYQGAFALPAGDEWTWGGHAMAYFPGGDPDGPRDGYPGSLYVVGHAWEQRVGQISIPRPLRSRLYSSLRTVEVLEEPADITGGRLGDCIYFDRNGVPHDCKYREVAGLEYLDGLDLIAWNLRDWYNVSGFDLDSLGWSRRDMSAPQGVWHIGPRFDPGYHSARTSDYLFKVPRRFAKRYLDDKWLLAGNHREAGAFGGSQGPTLFATAPWQDGDPPSDRTELDAVALLYYPEVLACLDDDNHCHFPGYRVSDYWGGGVWVELGKKRAVLIFGRKGLGENYYGEGGAGACDPTKGWHSDPYEPRILFYRTTDLAAVAGGEREPWKVIPYATHFPRNVLFDPDCGRFAATAYDSRRRLIYATEDAVNASGAVVVHVWKVRRSRSPVTGSMTFPSNRNQGSTTSTWSTPYQSQERG